MISDVISNSSFLRKTGFYALILFCCSLCVFAITQEEYSIFILSMAMPLLGYFVKYPIYLILLPYVLLVPFDEILIIGSGSQGTTYTRLLGLAAIVSFSLNIVIRKVRWHPKKHHLLTIGFICFGALSGLWAISWEMTTARIPVAFSLLLLYILAAWIPVDRQHIRSITVASIIGGTTAALYSLLTFYITGTSYNDMNRASLISGESQADPNQFAFSLLLPLAFSINQVCEGRNTRWRFATFLACLVLTAGIVITGSRGGLLGAIIIAISLSLRLGWKRIIIVSSLIFFTFQFAAGTIQSRFSTAWETGGAGRTSIWRVGVAAAQHRPLLGYGLSNFPMAYQEYRSVDPTHGYERGSHNIYLGTLVELGAVGLLILLFCIAGHIRQLKSFPSCESDTLKAAIAGMLFAAFFLDVLWRKSFWLSLIIINLYINSRCNSSAPIHKKRFI